MPDAIGDELIHLGINTISERIQRFGLQCIEIDYQAGRVDIGSQGRSGAPSRTVSLRVDIAESPLLRGSYMGRAHFGWTIERPNAGDSYWRALVTGCSGGVSNPLVTAYVVGPSQERQLWAHVPLGASRGGIVLWDAEEGFLTPRVLEDMCHGSHGVQLLHLLASDHLERWDVVLSAVLGFGSTVWE